MRLLLFILFFALCLLFPNTLLLDNREDSPFAYAVLLGALAKKHLENETPKARLTYLGVDFREVEVDGVKVKVDDLNRHYTDLKKGLEKRLKELTFGIPLPKDIPAKAEAEERPNHHGVYN